VFDGDGVIELDGHAHEVSRGDVIAIPSWCPTKLIAGAGFDLFAFSDAPVFEALNLAEPD
jgi:gentisate 1,2-dioxygenase